MSIGQQVFKRRTELGLTQNQLASMAKISLDTLSRIENDRKVNPTVYVVSALQKALDIRFKI